jgi:hypothetical protein
MFYISVYRAVDEPLTCQEYIQGHVHVLKDYGIENITSNNETWIDNPNMYCFIARDKDGEIVGGIRIQVADGLNPLPVENAIGKLDARIYELVKKYAINGGVGELCGLWNSKKVKGLGLSVILVRAAISTINQLNFHTLTGICAQYSLKMFQDVGFVINKTLGKDGAFIYPNESYIAQVVGILDGSTLDNAVHYDKERMLSLRKNKIQTRTETGPKGDFLVNYDMRVKYVHEISLSNLYI